ncbi:hypothetical protein K456DRAFT_1753593 [Colletotrichum gloeosporioides 23]|nr:hypothetical protein K456DRAFT_1753593 [Colletotrichum gloeosporioides 23]
MSEALQRESVDGHVPTPAVPASGRAVLVDPRDLPLVPQPKSDPLDPLNWSKSEYALILLIVCYAGLLSIDLTTAPVASLPLLQEHFNISYSEVSWSLGVPSLGLAIGILLFAGFSDIWGRRPVLLGTTLIALVATGCTTTANLPHGAYMALRLLQGIGAGPALNVGFAIVQHITYEHERGFKTGLWILSIDVGGIIGAFQVLSILTMGPVAYAQYSTKTQGLLWLGLISGTVTIEIVCSGRMLDNVASRLARSNNDIIAPAMYLWLAYPTALLGTGGCILWGLSMDRHWHFMVSELALFIFAAGLQMGNVTVVTYAITAYPDRLAFLVPWFINYWVETLGFTWSFATQGLITLLVIPSVMIL